MSNMLSLKFRESVGGTRGKMHRVSRVRRRPLRCIVEPRETPPALLRKF